MNLSILQTAPIDTIDVQQHLEALTEKLSTTPVTILLEELINKAKSEARKEFAERLKCRLTVFNKRIDGRCLYEISDEDIDNLLEEMEKEGNNNDKA